MFRRTIPIVLVRVPAGFLMGSVVGGSWQGRPRRRSFRCRFPPRFGSKVVLHRRPVTRRGRVCGEVVDEAGSIRLPRFEVRLASIDPVGQLRGDGPGEMLQRAVARFAGGQDRRWPALKVARAVTLHRTQQVRGADAAVSLEHHYQAEGADLIVGQADLGNFQRLQELPEGCRLGRGAEPVAGSQGRDAGTEHGSPNAGLRDERDRFPLLRAAARRTRHFVQRRYHDRPTLRRAAGNDERQIALDHQPHESGELGIQGFLADEVDDRLCARRWLLQASVPSRLAAMRSSSTVRTAWMMVMCISWMRAVTSEGTTMER